MAKLSKSQPLSEKNSQNICDPYFLNIQYRMIQIYVRNKLKRASILTIPSNIDGQHLYKLCSQLVQVPIDLLHLYLDGKLISASSDLQLKDKSIIHVVNVNDVRKEQITIKIKKLKDHYDPKEYHVDSRMSIKQFADQNLIHLDSNFLLIYLGKQLDSTKTFQEEDVQDQSQLIYSEIRSDLEDKRHVKSAQQLTNSPLKPPLLQSCIGIHISQTEINFMTDTIPSYVFRTSGTQNNLVQATQNNPQALRNNIDFRIHDKNQAHHEKQTQQIQKNANIITHQDYTSKQLLDKILKSIIQDNLRFGLLSQSIFAQINEQINKYFYTQSQNRALIQSLLIYMKQCNRWMIFNKQAKYDILFFEVLGESIQRTHNQVFLENKNILKVMSFLAQSVNNESYLNLKFDLSSSESIAVAGQVRELYKYDGRSFYFLSYYLYKSCFTLEKEGKSLVQIANILQSTLIEIKKKYPPAPSLGKSQDLQIKKIFEEAKFHPKKIDLSQIDLDKRKQAIIQFVLERAKEAQQSQKMFMKFIEETCRKKGSHLKVGLKIKDNQHIRAIDRVLQKMIDRQFKSYSLEDYEKEFKQEQDDEKGLSSYLKVEQNKYNLQMEDYYKKINKPIAFEVSDLLRGKCLFQSVEDIIECAEELIDKTQQQGCSLIKINNRLSKNTSDVVFKISVGKTVTELQLPIDFNIAHNEFNHKVYEIIRSKFHSSFAMLRILNEQIGPSLLQDVAGRLKYFKRTISKQEKEKNNIFQLSHTFQSLETYFLKFTEMIGFKPNLIKPKYIDHQIVKQFSKLLQQSKGLYLSNDDRKRVYQNNGQYYKGSNKYEKAYSQYKIYISIIPILYSDEKMQRKELEQCFRWIGTIMRKQNKETEAHKYISKSISVNRKEDQEDRLNYAKSLKNLGLICDIQNKFSQALAQYQKCLKIQEQIKGKDSIEVSETLNNIGNIERKRNKFNEAHQLYKKSLEIRSNLKGKDSMDCANVLNNMGLVYKSQKRYAESLIHFSRCLEIKQKVKGKGSLDCASTINNIGLVYLMKQKFNEAREHFQLCLQIEQRVQGKQSFECTYTLSNISLASSYLNQYQQSLDLLTRCLQIQEKFKGQEDVSCANTRMNIGIVLYKLAKYQQSIEQYQKAKKGYLKMYKIDSEQIKNVDNYIRASTNPP